jgi:glycosyltransferase involved in cell wall biosynthesis
MRLVHLAGYGGPYPGSFIPMLRAIMRAGRERGFEPEAVFTPISRTRGWLAELEEDGIPYRFSPEDASRTALTSWMRALLAERDVPTVLHTHFTSFDIAAAVAGGKRSRTRVIWHVHTPHLKGAPAFARNVLKYAVFGRRADQILCVSPGLVETTVRAGASRDEFGLPAGRPLLVHFGWDWMRKGGDVFEEALRRLRDSDQELAGVTVGGGEAARALGDRLGLGDELTVLEPTDKVQQMYAAADVFVAPSRAEGTPFSVLEAVSSGTAAVVSDIPGHATVGAHAPACVIAPLDAGAMAAEIRRLLDRDPAQVAADSLAGHAWLRENLGLGSWAAAMVDRYAGLLGGDAQSAAARST